MRVGILAYRQDPYISANTEIAYIIGEQIAKTHEVVYIGRKQDSAQEAIAAHNGIEIKYLNDKPFSEHSFVHNVLQKYGLFSIAFRKDIHSLRRIVKEKQVDSLICMTAPNDDAIIAYEAQLDIPVFLYQLDPFYNYSDSVNPMYKAYFMQMLQSFRHVLTTPLLMSDYSRDKEVSRYTQKMTALNHPKLVFRNHVNVERSDTPSLLYAGSLYRGVRSSSILIALKEALPASYRVVFCGSCDNRDDFDRLQTSGVVCKGFVDKETLAGEVDRADILINIGNSVSNQMASKVVDYIATCKPILNIIQFPDCPSVGVLGSYHNHFIILSNEIYRRRNELVRFIEEHFGVSEPWDDVYMHYFEYTPEYVTNCVMDKLAGQS